MKSKSKNLFVKSISLILLSFSVSAQLPTPKASQVQFEGETRPSIQVTLEPEAKEVKKAWRDFVKENYDVKMKGIGLFVNRDVLSAEEVKIDKLSPQTIDFHTKVEETKEGTRMEIFAAKGYDIFVDPSKNPQEFKRMEGMLNAFLADYIPEYYSERVEEQSEQVNDLADTRDEQEEEIIDKQEEIGSLKQEISDLEKAIEQGELNLEQTEKDLDKERVKLEMLKRKLSSLE